jgi:hypothetical protein
MIIQLKIKKHIDIDIIDKNLMQNLVGIDVLILSIEHWYNVLNPYIFLEGNQIIGRCNCDNVLGMTKHNNLLAYALKKLIQNVFKGILLVPQFIGILLLRSFSPNHFEHKHFNNGGSCNFTMPLKIPLYLHLMWMYNVQLEEILNVYKTYNSFTMVDFKLFDITCSFQLQSGGHPNNYQWSKEIVPIMANITIDINNSNDYVHWCLPRPIDMWNDMHVKTLRLLKLEDHM